MKTKYWIAILTAILLLCGISGWYLMGSREAAFRAEILSEGKVVQTVDLYTSATYTVTTEDGGYNVITVKDGKIAVTEADCPDHYCMMRGFCNGGTEIVCLPNRLVIRFLGESEIDGVVG